MSTHRTRNHFVAQVRAAVTDVIKLKATIDALLTDWYGGVEPDFEDATGADPNAQGYAGGDMTPNHEGLVKQDIADALAALTAVSAEIEAQIAALVNVRKYV